MSITKQIFAGIIVLLGATSCAVIEGEEKPIRPVSENSNLAHGSNTPTGDGALGGIGGAGGLSR